jgi:uncharacterized protein (TIGR00369 family)
MDLDEDQWEALRRAINGSPMYLHMGMEVLDAGEGRSRLRLKAGPSLHSIYGMLHGGVAATIMDSACGIALGTLLEPGEICVTVDLRVNYICNLKEGTIFAEGRVVHRGGQTGVTRAEVTAEDGTLIAVGMSTHFISRPGGVRMVGEYGAYE